MGTGDWYFDLPINGSVATDSCISSDMPWNVSGAAAFTVSCRHCEYAEVTKFDKTDCSDKGEQFQVDIRGIIDGRGSTTGDVSSASLLLQCARTLSRAPTLFPTKMV